MGLGDFFRRRRQRESVIPPTSTEVEQLGSFASSEGQPVVGKQVEGGQPQSIMMIPGLGGQVTWGGGTPSVMQTLSMLPGMFAGMKALADAAPEIQQAMLQSGQFKQNEDGSYQWTGGAENTGAGIQMNSINVDPGHVETVDMRGTGMREEIHEVMESHGVDMTTGAGSQGLDPNQAMAMQQQILAVLAKHGVPGIPPQTPGT